VSGVARPLKCHATPAAILSTFDETSEYDQQEESPVKSFRSSVRMGPTAEAPVIRDYIYRDQGSIVYSADDAFFGSQLDSLRD
jgi:hypothetical protein